MASSTKQWGQTPPMSTSLPTQLDNDKNAELVEELKRENNYEPHEETQKRVEALKLLNRVVQEFIREAGRRQRMPQNQIDQLGGKIYPYGSYRLGVYGPGSDIDTLAVAPKNVTRDEFFKLLPDILYKEAGKTKVTSLTPVPDAFVPIIKLVLNDIEIDLIFASIASRSTIPRDLDLNENKILDGLDEGMLKSVTGPRVTDEILALVPEQKTFRTALRAIKLWAQRRAIYANIVAYPGGVAWAMLVARVCQLYPHAVGGTLVQKFFGIMKAWKWPTPVLLKDIETGTHKTWNPKIYPSDAKNLMPIITPAYPSMCATFNIVQSTKTVISREIERGGKIADNIFNGTATWADLFKKHTFFTQDHKYYLSIIASATDPEEAKKWAGAVESKIRHLIALLETNKKLIALARPFTKGFKRTHKCENAEQLKAAKEGSMEYRIEEAKTIESTNPDILNTNGESTAPVGDDNTANGTVDSVLSSSGPDTKILYTYTYYIGIDPTPTLEQSRQLDIVKEMNAFRAKCYDWALAEQGKHELNVKPSRNFQLPDDLFEPGETKPTKPLKAKRKAPATNGIGSSDKSNGSVEPTAKRPAVEGPDGTPVTVEGSTNETKTDETNGAEHALQPA